jgi:protein-S-isoprenylcysteine O-methyltransferase Ste14
MVEVDVMARGALTLRPNLIASASSPRAKRRVARRYNHSAMTSATRRDLSIRTLIWLGVVALWIFLNKPEGVGLFDVRPGLPRLLGVVLIAAGIGGYVWSAGWLATGAPISRMTPVTLLRRGPYRYVRNPLYVSVAAVLLGVSTLYGPWGLSDVARIAIIALCVHVAVVRFEEPNTRKQFGAEYDEYCRSVPRWFPRWPDKT